MVSKKSLDDYLLQIRLGRKCGFNFDENKNEKIGVLRSHVDSKKVKKEAPRRKKRKLKDKKSDLIEPKLNLSIQKSQSKNKSSLGLKKGRSKSKSLKKINK